MFKGTRNSVDMENIAAQIRAEYESSPEYCLGAAFIDAVTNELGCDAQEAYFMLSNAKLPSGNEALCANAAQVLAQYALEDESFDAEATVNDEAFISLLREMPPNVALRLYRAEKTARESTENIASAQERGASDILEKLRARRELPRHSRSVPTASLGMDFNNMSSNEFRELKERLKRETFYR